MNFYYEIYTKTRAHVYASREIAGREFETLRFSHYITYY